MARGTGLGGGASGVDALDPSALLSSASAPGSTPSPEGLKLAIAVIPELTERKRRLDAHLQLSTRIVGGLKERAWERLFSCEQSIAEGSPEVRKEVMALVAAAEVPDSDAYRIYLQWLWWTASSVSSSQQLRSLLQKDLNVTAKEGALASRAAAFILSWLSLQTIPSMLNPSAASTAPANPQSSTKFARMVGSRLTRDAASLVSSIYNAASNSFQTLLTGPRPTTALGRTVDCLVERLMQPVLPGSGNQQQGSIGRLPPAAHFISTASTGSLGTVSRSSISHVILALTGPCTYDEWTEVRGILERRFGPADHSIASLKPAITVVALQVISGGQWMECLASFASPEA